MRDRCSIASRSMKSASSSATIRLHSIRTGCLGDSIMAQWSALRSDGRLTSAHLPTEHEASRLDFAVRSRYVAPLNSTSDTECTHWNQLTYSLQLLQRSTTAGRGTHCCMRVRTAESKPQPTVLYTLHRCALELLGPTAHGCAFRLARCGRGQQRQRPLWLYEAV